MADALDFQSCDFSDPRYIFFRSAGRCTLSSVESLDRNALLQIGRRSSFAREDKATKDGEHGADGGAGGHDLLRDEAGLSVVFQLKSEALAWYMIQHRQLFARRHDFEVPEGAAAEWTGQPERSSHAGTSDSPGNNQPSRYV